MTRQSVRMLLVSLALTAAVSAAQAKDTDQDSKHDSGDEPDTPRILKDENPAVAV